MTFWSLLTGRRLLPLLIALVALALVIDKSFLDFVRSAEAERLFRANGYLPA